MNYILETPRLKLREFNFDDADFIIQLLNSEGWQKFIGDRNVKNTDDACAYLEKGPLTSYRENGFGLCLVELKTDKIPIGMSGLIKRSNLPHPDIGFAFLPGFEGQGFGFEISAAIMKHARENLYLDTILGITVAHNQRSIRLLEKLGLSYVRNISIPDDPDELLLYSSSATKEI